MYYYDGKNSTKYANGATVQYSPSPFSSLAAVEHCPCEDGKARFVRITGEPDTAFSVPARTTVKVSGKTKTVTGFVTFDESGPTFIANKYGKNGALIEFITYVIKQNGLYYTGYCAEFTDNLSKAHEFSLQRAQDEVNFRKFEGVEIVKTKEC